MRQIRKLSELRSGVSDRASVVSIGKFDGVHLGHTALFARMRELADAHGLETVVFTFDENPLMQLAPEKCPRAIMSTEQRLQAFADLGVDTAIMVPFDDELRTLSPEAYVREILVERIGAAYALVGQDFRFGHRGVGDANMLRELGREHGITVEIAEDVTLDGERVSSTSVRDKITSGDVAGAARLMGHRHAVRGEVVHGAKRGRELGFPTANIEDDHEGLEPSEGIYAGWATLDGGEPLKAAISVGPNPTFTPNAPNRVEVHLLDFDGDIYGRQLSVEFVDRLRGNIAFEGIEPLIAQMQSDVAEVREILAADAKNGTNRTA